MSVRMEGWEHAADVALITVGLGFETVAKVRAEQDGEDVVLRVIAADQAGFEAQDCVPIIAYDVQRRIDAYGASWRDAFRAAAWDRACEHYDIAKVALLDSVVD